MYKINMWFLTICEETWEKCVSANWTQILLEFQWIEMFHAEAIAAQKIIQANWKDFIGLKLNFLYFY